MGDKKENVGKGGNAAEAYAQRENVRAVMEAAQSGDVDMLRGAALQFEDSDVREVRDGNGRTALHFAAQFGHRALCLAAIKEFGLDVNSEDTDGLTPLGLACVGGRLETVEALLENGAVLTGSEKNEIQPIHHAAAAGNTPIVKLLLDRGADLNAPSNAGPPLLWTAGAAKSKCLKFLLDRGADPNTKSPEGVTALIMASASGCLASVSMLIDRGADATVQVMGGVTALHVTTGAATEDVSLKLAEKLLAAGADPNIADDEAHLPIHAAAMEGHRKVVEHLFPLTSQPEGTSSDDWSVDAIMSKNKSKNVEAGPSSQVLKVEIPEPEKPDFAAYEDFQRQGNIAFVGKDYEKALEVYSKALAFWTKDAKVWANRGATFLRLKRSEEALHDTRIARTLDPKYVKAWFREGCSLRDLKRWEEAALAFFEGLRVEPENKDLVREFENAIKEGRKEHQKVNGHQGGCGCCPSTTITGEQP
ncbi:hypothetical protein BSKO_05154 [Bryopsis sp. KO-2023]|nr:hypothetical protein BSKO_05154 [Bryopsis sp. KO-2023]